MKTILILFLSMIWNLSTPAQGAEPTAPSCYASIRAAEKAAELCENFRQLNRPIVNNAKEKCISYYTKAVEAIQAMCRYRQESAQFQIDTEAFASGVSLSQRLQDDSAARVDQSARQLSRTWYDRFDFQLTHLDAAYSEYQTANRDVGRHGQELLREEVERCGREESAVSYAFLGLAYNATEEAQNNHRKVREELFRLREQTHANAEAASAHALFNADRGSRLDSILPQAAPARDPQLPHAQEESVVGSSTQALASSLAQEGLQDTLRRSSVSRLRRGAAPSAGIVMIGLDLALDHEKMDLLKLFTTGARLVLLAAGGAAGFTLPVAIAADQFLGILENQVRSFLEQEFLGRAVPYLHFAQSRVAENAHSSSRSVAENYHTERNHENCLSGQEIARRRVETVSRAMSGERLVRQR